MDTTPENKLTTEKIDAAVNDFALVGLVWQRLWDDFEDASDWQAKPLQAFYSWNESKTFFILVHQFAGEINNGGFEQFYGNGGDKYAEEIPVALRYFGAEEFAALAEAANKIYRREYAKITATLDGTVEGFVASYEDSPLEQFDNKFYELDDGTLEKLLAQYIRQHKQDFIDE